MWACSRSLRTGCAGDLDVEVRRPDDEVGQDGVGGGAQVGSLKPVHAAASERPCSKPTQTGFRNSGQDEGQDAEPGGDGDDEVARRVPRRSTGPS